MKTNKPYQHSNLLCVKTQFWRAPEVHLKLMTRSPFCGRLSTIPELIIQPGSFENIPRSSIKASQFFPADVVVYSFRPALTRNKAVLLSSCSSCFPNPPSRHLIKRDRLITGSRTPFYPICISLTNSPAPSMSTSCLLA